MKEMCIPTIGSRIILHEDWKFDFYDEYRNVSLCQFKGVKDVPKYGTYPPKVAQEMTFPKGTVLRVDRIFIRQNMKDFDSITFSVVKTSLETKTAKPKKIRFWAKLTDCNNIKFDFEV